MIPEIRHRSTPVAWAFLALGLIGLATATGCARKRPIQEVLSGFRVVRPAVASEIMRDNPDLLIVALSSPEDFHALGHIEGAINIPLEDLESRLSDVVRVLRSGLLIYCHIETCNAEAMSTLRENGFRYVFILEGGIQAWKDEGFDTVSPPL